MYNIVTLKCAVSQFAYGAKVAVKKFLVGISYNDN